MKKAASLILLFMLACFAMGAVTVVDLTFQVTGILPVANGGTGLSTIYNGTYASGTISATVTATTLCSTTNCPAGTYQVSVYLNETGTGCTTVTSGKVSPTVLFKDNQGTTRTIVLTGTTSGGSTLSTGMTLTTAGTGWYQAWVATANSNGAAVSGTDAFQLTLTFVACATPGSWTGYQARAFVTRVG